MVSKKWLDNSNPAEFRPSAFLGVHRRLRNLSGEFGAKPAHYDWPPINADERRYLGYLGFADRARAGCYAHIPIRSLMGMGSQCMRASVCPSISWTLTLAGGFPSLPADRVGWWGAGRRPDECRTHSSGRPSRWRCPM